MVAGVAGWWALRAPSLHAVVLHKAPLVRTLEFSARVVTTSRVDIGSTLTGRVSHVDAREGTVVRAGDPLIRLESDELRAAVNQAKANESQAVARLDGLRSTGRNTAQAAVAQANSVLVAAQTELARNQALVAHGFISEARLDESLRAVAVAQAQQAGAQAQRMANTDQGTEIRQAQSLHALAKANVAAAESRWAQSMVTAPAKGKVLNRMVEPGQIVQPGRALMTLALESPMQLVAQVDERYLGQLQVGQSAQVIADAFPEQRFGAIVQTIAPRIDAQRGSVEVKLGLGPSAPAFLQEDMTLSVEVETARRESAMAVPLEALRPTGANVGSTVLIAVDGRVEQRHVRLGARSLHAVEVVDGLKEGEWVLIGGSPAVGSRVRVNTSPRSTPALESKLDLGNAMGHAMGR